MSPLFSPHPNGLNIISRCLSSSEGTARQAAATMHWRSRPGEEDTPGVQILRVFLWVDERKERVRDQAGERALIDANHQDPYHYKDLNGALVESNFQGRWIGRLVYINYFYDF